MRSLENSALDLDAPVVVKITDERTTMKLGRVHTVLGALWSTARAVSEPTWSRWLIGERFLGPNVAADKVTLCDGQRGFIPYSSPAFLSRACYKSSDLNRFNQVQADGLVPRRGECWGEDGYLAMRRSLSMETGHGVTPYNAPRRSSSMRKGGLWLPT